VLEELQIPAPIADFFVCAFAVKVIPTAIISIKNKHGLFITYVFVSLIDIESIFK
jgi:hypothetical protein